MKKTTAIIEVSLASASVANTFGCAAVPLVSSIIFTDEQCFFQTGSSKESWLVSSIGREARRILQQSSAGSVLAVFQRSFYVQCNHGIICIGLASLGQGPLHVLLGSEHDSLCQGITTGLVVNIRMILKPLCGDQWVSAASAIPPEYSGQVLTDASWRMSKQRTLLFNACDAPALSSGFGWLLNESCWQCGVGLKALSLDQLGPLDRGLRMQSFAAVTALYAWLHDSLLNVPSDVHALLGAGPGLTPAGDDLLAGVMLALHRIDGGDRVEMLWQTLQPAVCARTNVISAAHLQLAARGQCAEPVLALLDHYLVSSLPDSPSDILARARETQHFATRIGSSSGWDMLAGMSLVVRAFSDSSNYL